jgi:hypothetical protein
MIIIVIGVAVFITAPIIVLKEIIQAATTRHLIILSQITITVKAIIIQDTIGNPVV